MRYCPSQHVVWMVLQLLLVVTAVCHPPQPNIPLVRVRNGTLAGTHNSFYDQDFFLGIPFAAPPVDNLRLHMPVPSDAWNGTRIADSYGPWCIGNSIGFPGFSQSLGPMSEDCLHLNIVRPSCTRRCVKLPVVAWIHGGGWMEGSAADGRYNGSFLVDASVHMGSPIIFVSFNYRLGLFGMMNGPVIERAGLANLALHDQRQALAWIQENIEAFGGDPSRVTVMGESAGAGSIGYHLLAYGGRDDGLFRAAIAESGGPFTVAPFRNSTERLADFNTVLNITECTAAWDPLSCLRAAPVESLRKASLQVPASFTVDGTLLQDTNARLLQAGRFIKVPLLIGSNRNEGTSALQSFMPSAINTEEDFVAFVLQLAKGLPKSAALKWSRLYQEEIDKQAVAGLGTVLPNPNPKLGSEYGKATLWLGDNIFTAGRRYANQIWADHGVPSYSYFFDVVTANVDNKTLGVAHFQEIPFVFGNTEGVGWDINPFPTGPESKKFIKLADVMSRMWVSFIVTMSPNSHQVVEVRTRWPKYSRINPTNIVFSVSEGIYLQKDIWRAEALRIFAQLATVMGK